MYDAMVVDIGKKEALHKKTQEHTTARRNDETAIAKIPYIPSIKTLHRKRLKKRKKRLNRKFSGKNLVLIEGDVLIEFNLFFQGFIKFHSTNSEGSSGPP